MTIKIKAPKAWTYPDLVGTWNHRFENCVPIRIVRERDWRKLMRLVKACEDYKECDGAGWVVVDALDALRKKK